jgi:T-complex protein 1 subunit zeta
LFPIFSAVNSGFDSQDTIVKLQEESTTLNQHVGLDISTGEAVDPKIAGIYDNYVVKKQIIHSW